MRKRFIKSLFKNNKNCKNAKSKLDYEYNYTYNYPYSYSFQDKKKKVSKYRFKHSPFIKSFFFIDFYYILISEWLSNSKFAFLDVLRDSARMISYKFFLGFSILCFIA
jgi:hypothetical protein